MDISNINGISTGDIKSFFNNTSLTKTDKTDSFSDVLSAAMGSIGETNDLQKRKRLLLQRQNLQSQKLQITLKSRLFLIKKLLQAEQSE